MRDYDVIDDGRFLINVTNPAALNPALRLHQRRSQLECNTSEEVTQEPGKPSRSLN
jgi:hypothetical protein